MSKGKKTKKAQYRLKFSLFFAILVFAWLAFEGFFVSRFNKLSRILLEENDGLLILIFVSVCLLGLLYIVFKYGRIRVFSSYLVGILMLIIAVYLRYRFGEYNFWGLWEGKWKIDEDYYSLALIVGIILPTCFLFIILRKSIWDRLKLFGNRLRLPWLKLTRENGEERNLEKQPELLSDAAKKQIAEDKYNFKPHVEEFVKKIRGIKGRRSIGLLGDWGSGKSTYMNMVREKLEEGECIIIEFNPRHSKSIDRIQKDFFNSLEAELEVYDMTISRSLNKYLSAIGMNSSSGLVSFFVYILRTVFSETDMEGRKRKIAKSIREIDKQVVVFIDDFDRLLCNEILEVMRLIDGYFNFDSIDKIDKAYTNMIFISAYDKRQVTEIFSKTNIATPHKFAEKFFDTEQNIPLHRKDLILDNFRKLLTSNI